MNRTRTFRRLGLAAGTLLALAVPSVASASALVEADRFPEGSQGRTQLPATVTVRCDNSVEPQDRTFGLSPNNYCQFTITYDRAASTARFDDDVAIPQPRVDVVLKVGESEVVPLVAEAIGDRFPERDEKLAITVREQGFHWINSCVWEVCSPRIVQVWDVPRTYDANTLLNDDGPLPRDNIKIKKIGKVKAPVNAPESQVERYDWNDGTSVGANCLTPETAGWKGAFKVWGLYIPGCVVKVSCPAEHECVAHARSTVRSTGRDLTNANQRLTAHVGNGTPPWTHDTVCEAAHECTAADDSIRIQGGGSAELQCNGVHGAKTEKAALECLLDLEFVE